jgi:hypothetical protein
MGPPASLPHFTLILALLSPSLVFAQSPSCSALKSLGANALKTVQTTTQALEQHQPFNLAEACKKVRAADTREELTNAMLALSKRQNEILKDQGYPSNRHQVGKALNRCWPSKDSEALVITFAGTSEYDPRLHHLMSYGFNCFDGNHRLRKDLQDDYYSATVNALKKKGHANQSNSINKGITPLFLSDPKLAAHASRFDFATFPSEEREFLAKSDLESQLESLWNTSGAEAERDAQGLPPPGIRNAVSCTETYLKKAKAMGIRPKIIVVGHSSGGRSAVKYHQRLQTLYNPFTGKKGVKTDFTFTLDPVVEAHHALADALSQTTGKVVESAVDAAGESIGLDPVPEKEKVPVKIWKRDPQNQLYKNWNCKSWYNVYQTEDTYGMGPGAPLEGIMGNSIHQADRNIHISGFQSGKDGKVHAHGGITSRPEAKNAFLSKMYELFP